MKAPIFVDTSYVLALANTADRYHERARTTSQHVHGPFLTTEAVLTEIGNAFSRARWRELGVATIRALRSDPNIEIVPVDSALFDRAFDLYSERPDKEWGLTDCISSIVMQEHGLVLALTADHHFAQAGFQNMLVTV
jgi:predicted nucleic acid-binding protein